jgi:hypothetical protein
VSDDPRYPTWAQSINWRDHEPADKIEFAADSKERSGCVNYAKIRIPLQIWNEWSRSPADITKTIASLQSLQVKLEEIRQRHAGYQAKVRQLSQEIGGMER